MDESRLDSPTTRLEWSQQTWYDFCKELFCDFIKVGIYSSDALFPFDVRLELTTIPLLLTVAPLVLERDMAIEGGDMEAKFTCR